MSSRPISSTKISYGAVPSIKDAPDIDERPSVREFRGGALSSSLRKVRDEYSNLSESLRSFAAEGQHLSVRDVEGDTTVTAQTFNLVKNLVGAGVLALPSGIAAFGNTPSAIFPAILATVLMGAIFGYYFLLIGRTCHLTQSATFREVWEDTMGNQGAVFVSAVNMLKPALGNLAYSMILADTCRSLFENIGFQCSRTLALLLITLVALLPLCLLKNLKVLAPFSIAGTGSIFLVAIIMGIRYFDGSYDVTGNGRFVDDLPKEYEPSFGTKGATGALSPQILVLVCMLFEAFVAHYNSPRMFVELKQRTVPRFRTVVVNAFGLSGIIYILFSSFGYLTFGSSSDGYILNNFSTNDKLATICRIAIAFTILLTYPVVFIGFRDGVLDLLHAPMEKETSNYLDIVSVLLLMLVTLIAVFVRDLGALNTVGGGTLATAIVFVFPTLMYRESVYSYYQNEPPRGIVREVRFAYALMFLGILMGAIGVWMALVSN